jgi:hypothetical protein
MPTTMPPTIPANKPENSGAFDANAMPRQSGTATRNTTRPEIRSRANVFLEETVEVDITGHPWIKLILK